MFSCPAGYMPTLHLFQRQPSVHCLGCKRRNEFILSVCCLLQRLDLLMWLASLCLSNTPTSHPARNPGSHLHFAWTNLLTSHTVISCYIIGCIPLQVMKCPKRYVHDWRSCPFAHPTENARRRDPREVRYMPVPCPDYERGLCLMVHLPTQALSCPVLNFSPHPVLLDTCF